MPVEQSLPNFFFASLLLPKGKGNYTELFGNSLGTLGSSQRDPSCCSMPVEFDRFFAQERVPNDELRSRPSHAADSVATGRSVTRFSSSTPRERISGRSSNRRRSDPEVMIRKSAMLASAGTVRTNTFTRAHVLRHMLPSLSAPRLLTSPAHSSRSSATSAHSNRGHAQRQIPSFHSHKQWMLGDTGLEVALCGDAPGSHSFGSYLEYEVTGPFSALCLLQRTAGIEPPYKGSHAQLGELIAGPGTPARAVRGCFLYPLSNMSSSASALLHVEKRDDPWLHLMLYGGFAFFDDQDELIQTDALLNVRVGEDAAHLPGSHMWLEFEGPFTVHPNARQALRQQQQLVGSTGKAGHHMRLVEPTVDHFSKWDSAAGRSNILKRFGYFNSNEVFAEFFAPHMERSSQPETRHFDLEGIEYKLHQVMPKQKQSFPGVLRRSSSIIGSLLGGGTASDLSTLQALDGGRAPRNKSSRWTKPDSPTRRVRTGIFGPKAKQVSSERSDDVSVREAEVLDGDERSTERRRTASSGESERPPMQRSASARESERRTTQGGTRQGSFRRTDSRATPSVITTVAAPLHVNDDSIAEGSSQGKPVGGLMPGVFVFESWGGEMVYYKATPCTSTAASSNGADKRGWTLSLGCGLARPRWPWATRPERALSIRRHGPRLRLAQMTAREAYDVLLNEVQASGDPQVVMSAESFLLISP